MGKTWSRIRPNPKTARILLAALFALPILSSLILPLFPSYEGLPHDFGPSVFLLPAILLVEFPIPGILALVIVFGSIFLWEWCRKSLSVAWLACWVGSASLTSWPNILRPSCTTVPPIGVTPLPLSDHGLSLGLLGHSSFRSDFFSQELPLNRRIPSKHTERDPRSRTIRLGANSPIYR